MPELLRVLAPGTAASPRRGVLSALATVGVGSILGRLGASSAEAKKKGKNKNKGKTKDRCPKPPICPKGCPILYTLAEGSKVCSVGTIGEICPSERCFSSEQCLFTQGKDHCIVEREDLETGERSPHGCSDSLPGICASAIACTM